MCAASGAARRIRETRKDSRAGPQSAKRRTAVDWCPRGQGRRGRAALAARGLTPTTAQADGSTDEHRFIVAVCDNLPNYVIPRRSVRHRRQLIGVGLPSVCSARRNHVVAANPALAARLCRWRPDTQVVSIGRQLGPRLRLEQTASAWPKTLTAQRRLGS